MARFDQVSELQARRRVLLHWSAAYRQAIRLEFRNLRLHGARIRSGFALLRAARLLIWLLPLAGSWASARFARKPGRKPRSSWSRLIGLGLAGWRLYRTYGPFLRVLAFQRLARPGALTK